MQGSAGPPSNEDLDPFADSLSADGAHRQGGAALQARPVPALEDQFDLVVNTDGARDALFHLPVTVLEVLHKLLLVCGFRAGATLHFCTV